MSIRSSSHTAIGVDIGRRTIKAAQLIRSAGQYRLHALALLPRPNSEEEVSVADAQALQDVLKRQGFRGRHVVLAAPEKHVLRATLEVPTRIAGAPVEQIVRMELSRLHNILPDSFEMAYWEVRAANNTRPMTQMLAVGCPHAAADGVLDAFENSGFCVTALDVRSAAAARACQPLVLPAPEITGIVDLGWRSSWLLFVSGPSLIYERALEGVFLAELAERLREAFGIPLEAVCQILGAWDPAAGTSSGGLDRETVEAIHKHLRNHFDKLIDELRVPLSYAHHHFPGEGVKRLLLIGGGAALPQVASYCEERLGTQVRMAGPDSLLASPPELLAKANNAALTVAVGLAQFEEAC
jgi:type IV pilus assembly protein PilM